MMYEEDGMTDRGRVLLADDEVHFQQATAELLREQGYACNVVSDAYMAAEQLHEHEYHVLIADIKMPGNANLEFIHGLAHQREHLSIILVTGYPSTETAIDSVHLPVVAYLVKPFKFDELLPHVRFGVDRSKAYQAVCRIQDHVQAWHHELGESAQAVLHTTSQTFFDPLGVFLDASFNRIMMTLSELKNVTTVLAQYEEDRRNVPFHDPRVDLLKNALVDTVITLEKTRHAFKSKDLGHLRRRLEALITKLEAGPAML